MEVYLPTQITTILSAFWFTSRTKLRQLQDFLQISVTTDFDFQFGFCFANGAAHTYVEGKCFSVR